MYRQKKNDNTELNCKQGRRLKLGDKHPRTQESLNLLIDLCKTLNQPEEADRWRAKLPADDTTSGQSQNASGRMKSRSEARLCTDTFVAILVASNRTIPCTPSPKSRTKKE
ncbi:MAG: hypothetical protein ACYSWO_23925 [Planctomycetota bacterium]